MHPTLSTVRTQQKLLQSQRRRKQGTDQNGTKLSPSSMR